MSASKNTNSSRNQKTPSFMLKHQVTFSENTKPRQQNLNKSYESPLPENSYKVWESIPIKSPNQIKNGRNTDMGFRTIDHNNSVSVNPNRTLDNSLM